MKPKYRRQHMPLCALGIYLIASVFVSGCETMRGYDGPSRPRSAVARIVSSMHISAGEPISIVIRRVDNTDVGVRFNSVDVLPGGHSLLIDCTVTESKLTSRHHLDVDVEAGGKYRLVANTRLGNRECDNVELIAVD